MIRHSRRTFSKFLVTMNSLGAWATMIYAIYQNTNISIVLSGFSFIAGIGAYYMHVGQKDLEKLTNVSTKQP